MTANESLFSVIKRVKFTHFACVVIGVFLATLIRFPIQSAIHSASPFLFYFPVVVAMAVAFGLRSGLLATGLSVLPADYFWMIPEGSFVVDFGQICHIVGFSFAGISVSWLSDTSRKRKQLEEYMRAALTSMGEAIVTTDCAGRIVYLNAAAQVLTELNSRDASGRMLGSVLNLVAENGGDALNGTFQVAFTNDEIDELPERLILLSQSGRQYRVAQKTSRILDSSGRKLGLAVLFHRLDSNTEPDLLTPVADSIKKDDLNSQSRSPRVAMVTTNGCMPPHRFWSSTDGGEQASFILELSNQLAGLGYEVDIWTGKSAGCPGIKSVSQRVRIIRVPERGQDFRKPELLLQSLREWGETVLQTIAQHQLKYEFVNSHGWDGGIAGQILSRKLGVPHIHTPHSFGMAKNHEAAAGSPCDTSKSEGQNDLDRRIAHERSLYAAADLIVATSGSQQGILLRDYEVPQDKCRLIPHGYDERHFFPVGDSVRQAIRRRLNFTGPVVQAIGLLADEKDCELLIRAFAVVSQQLPEVTFNFVIASNVLTPCEAARFIQLRALATQFGLSEKVRFNGYTSDDTLADYYRAADVFVLTSQQELLGPTVAEAMACGTPVVVNPSGCWHDSLRMGLLNLYVSPHDPESLGIRIMDILRQSHLLPNSNVGAQNARSHFSWPAVAQHFLTSAKLAGKSS
jgi:mannosylfructose-phosphate synthase